MQYKFHYGKFHPDHLQNVKIKSKIKRCFSNNNRLPPLLGVYLTVYIAVYCRGPHRSRYRLGARSYDRHSATHVHDGAQKEVCTVLKLDTPAA